MSASSLTEKEFVGYIEYFQTKDRAGIVYLKDFMIHFLPPGPVTDKFVSAATSSESIQIKGEKKFFVGVLIPMTTPPHNN